MLHFILILSHVPKLSSKILTSSYLFSDMAIFNAVCSSLSYACLSAPFISKILTDYFLLYFVAAIKGVLLLESAASISAPFVSK